MSQDRIDNLLAKLVKGHQKIREYFERLDLEEWQSPILGNPNWGARNLLAHYVSSEQNLLELAQNVAASGSGAPEGFDIDRFNAEEQIRLRDKSKLELFDEFDRAHQTTLAWARTLTDQQLNRIGKHPVLGDVSVEDILTAVYSHQILHLRDLARLRKGTPHPVME
jgi:DinB superfamily